MPNAPKPRGLPEQLIDLAEYARLAGSFARKHGRLRQARELEHLYVQLERVGGAVAVGERVWAQRYRELLEVGRLFANVGYNAGQWVDMDTRTSHVAQALVELQRRWDAAISAHAKDGAPALSTAQEA